MNPPQSSQGITEQLLTVCNLHHLPKHLTDDLDGFLADPLLGFLRGGSDVRRHGNLRMMKKPFIFAGLLREDVNRRACQMAAVKGIAQSCRINQDAAGGIDQKCAILHQRNLLSRQERRGIL